MHAKVVVNQVIGEVVRLHVLTHKLDRRAGREGEESSRSQQTRRLWNRSLRIAESHRSPVTENDVKAGVRQWHIFGTGFNQGEVYTCFLHEAAGILELSRGEIKPNRPCPSSSQRNGPASSSTTQFQHVFTRTENVQFFLWNAPHSPCHGLLS